MRRISVITAWLQTMARYSDKSLRHKLYLSSGSVWCLSDKALGEHSATLAHTVQGTDQSVSECPSQAMFLLN